MQTQRRPIADLRPNPDNPRVIKDDKFRKLVESIRTFPQMLELRPIVVRDDLTVLGGNMRLQACKEAGLKEVPVVIASDLTPEQQREFVVKDNVSFGEWDWDDLANNWDAERLDAWGLDVPEFTPDAEKDNPYNLSIAAPVYTPRGECPDLAELADRSTTERLMADIAAAQDVPDDVKAFLTLAAQRHTVFSYERIAEYYAHAPKEVQALMEQSALVIIDFNKAVEHGYVKLSSKLSELFAEEYDEAQ